MANQQWAELRPRRFSHAPDRSRKERGKPPTGRRPAFEAPLRIHGARRPSVEAARGSENFLFDLTKPGLRAPGEFDLSSLTLYHDTFVPSQDGMHICS